MKAIVVALLTAALAACSSNHGLSSDGGGGTGAGGAGPGQTVFTFRQNINRNVDVLFMVDNSSSTSAQQSKLTATFSSYVDTLKALPGGLPSIHLGVVSSSMGAGRNPSIDHCPQGGDQGVFQTKPLGPTCGKATLAPGQNFIINVNGQPNYTGELADMFSCIAQLGDAGCGFEHQLASVLRALGADGAPPPAQNGNFLRADAFLQIVLLTDEDDCSAPPDSDLFDSTDTSLASPLGPLQSYRCNEFGHLCGGKAPPRMPTGEVDLGMCVSNEKGRLLPVAAVAEALKSLKADPSQILVAAIAGPPTPYKVNAGPSQIKGDQSLWPYVEESCTQNEQDGSQTVADPGVRIKQWVDAFGGNGVFATMCAPSYAPALQSFAEQVGKAMAAPCLDASVDPGTCTFVDHGLDATGKTTSTPLRQCADSVDAGPCWFTESNTLECPTSAVRSLQSPGAAEWIC